ncbi:DNA repair protein RAD50 isoform X2 [Aphidius gifuensis]|uniref:DNA repair protein RAD50 isoform X2 n=1 Tax=Aphidius gifuensis TaxID=684658 RepID=UPI001CDB5783|nr:DNA repair protein RAD50 isoform X2 [Aphidius gifuensis]
MSRVKRLSIRGIRNFDDAEEAHIKFERPLTLIVGQNGVGKTTIIECLRFAATGEFPPNSDRAEFTDRKGERFIVTRAIESMRVDNTIRFKSLDNVICKINPKTKEEIQLNHRCADMDKETTNLLGLPKAIINNVIFCHQDEANWPLEESKKLKDRFDEIFDTVEYNKALEYIHKKLIPSKRVEAGIIGQEKKYLKARSDECRAKLGRLREFKNRKNEISETIQNWESDLEPKKERLKEINKIKGEYNELKIFEQNKIVKFDMLNKQIKNIESAIKETFIGTDDELLYQINEDKKILDKKNKMIDNIQMEIEDLIKEEKKLTIQLSKQDAALGKLGQQMADLNRMIEDRNEMLNKAITTWQLEPIDVTSEHEVMSTIKIIDEKMEKFKESIDEKCAKHDKVESGLSKNLDILKNEHAKIKSELERDEEDVIETENTIRITNNKILRADSANQKLEKINNDIEEIEKSIEQIENEIANDNLADKIKNETKNLKKFEEQQGQLEEEISIIQDQNALTMKHESLKKDITKMQKSIDEFRAKHENNIYYILKIKKLPEVNLKEQIDEVQSELTYELQELNKQIKIEDNKAVCTRQTIKHKKQDLNSKIAEIDIDKKRVLNHCSDYNSLDNELEQHNKIVKHLSNKRGMFSYQKSAFVEYMKKLENEKPCCPLCERNFADQLEAKTLVKKMTNDLKQHPEMMKKLEKELKIATDKQQVLLSLKPIVEKILKFENNTKQILKNNIEQEEINLNKTLEIIENLESSKIEPEKKLDLLKKMHSDVILWDQYINDITMLKISFDDLEDELTNSGRKTNKTMDELRDEQIKLRSNIKKLREKISLWQDKKTKNDEYLKNANDKRTKCLENQLRIHNEVQEVKQLKDNMITLKNKLTNLKNSIEQLKKSEIKAKDKVNSISNDLKNIKNNHRIEKNKDTELSINYSHEIRELKGIQGSVKRLIDQNIKQQLEKTKIIMADIKSSVDDNKQIKNQKEEEINQIKEDISCHETKKRNLTDNQLLRKEMKTYDILKDEINEIQKKIKKLNFDNFKEEERELLHDNELIEGNINRAKGQKEEIQQNIKLLDEELKRPENLDVEKLYKNKCIEHAVIKLVIEDLLIYYAALDDAMTVYHEERMNTVNRTMKKLWEYIYTGSDTTSIQIRTEAASGTTKKRVFNYKLVQIKHGVEMDMKGRCSAGQRVLASIIMRLALAETFCEQCGILALDEPTTNLDEDNARSLASTLYKYVELRAKHRSSFQLIIITHDENFISKLSQLSSHNRAYELYRQENGLTSIRCLEMQQPEDNTQRNYDDNDTAQRNNHNTDDDDDDDETQNPRPGTSKKKNSGTSAATTDYGFKYDF